MSKLKEITIAICTYKRPKMLTNAIESIRNLVLPEDYNVSLVIVDNCPDKSAELIVQSLKKNFPINITYTHEINKGYAFARNRALKKALKLDSDFIAFIDDDQYVDKNWLVAFLDAMNKYNADVVFSYPKYEFDDFVPNFIRKNFIFNLKNNRKTGEIRESASTGSVLFNSKIVSKHNICFDENLKNMLGEDIIFFNQAYRKGYNIIWCKEAIVYETICKERGCVSWILNRSFANGYLKSYNRKRDKNSYIKVHVVFLNLILFTIFSLISIFMGPTMLFNTLGKLYKTMGELAGMLSNSPLNYHKKAVGY